MGGWCCEMAAFGAVKSSNSYYNHIARVPRCTECHKQCQVGREAADVPVPCSGDCSVSPRCCREAGSPWAAGHAGPQRGRWLHPGEAQPVRADPPLPHRHE